MTTISTEFCLITLFILLIFVINVSHMLYLIVYKNEKQHAFLRLILLNFSFASIIVVIWVLPFFYFRMIWPPESSFWRIWSFLFHVVDAVQLYSVLLLISNTNIINLIAQRFFICLSWVAPIVTYSPLLWLSPPSHQLDHYPYRRLCVDVPWWILPTLYSTTYIVPIFISLVLSSITLCWPWIYNQYKRLESLSLRQESEHRENMAELTSLVETVLNFELEQSTADTLDTWVPSISSLSHQSSITDHKSLSYVSNTLNRSLSYKASQDNSFLIFDYLSSSSHINEYIQKQQSQINYRILFIITCLLLIIHLPYVICSLLNLYETQLPMFIYIHWIGTVLLPIIHLKNN